MAEEKDLITFPTVILRNTVIFPRVSVQIDVVRENTIQALEEAMSLEKPVFFVGQEALKMDLGPVEQSDLYSIGVVGFVNQLVCIPGDGMRVLIDGICRGRLDKIVSQVDYLECTVTSLTIGREVKQLPVRTELAVRKAIDLFREYMSHHPHIAVEVYETINRSRSVDFVADRIAQELNLRERDKQDLLQELQPMKRLKQVTEYLRRELDMIEVEGDLENKTHERLDGNQQEYYLREQMKVIQEKLGEDAQKDLEELKQRIDALDLPKEVDEKLRKEHKRLTYQSFSSSEAAVIRNYLETCLDVPWNVSKKHKINVNTAKKQLDKDHFGLEKVKERILEFLAVRQLSPDLKGQVLCLVGPPGVGKTSVARSVARAMGREFARISLGGVCDEAEIRGHRKTYIGAMPGRIMSAVTKTKTNNPVLLLDELDKMGNDHRGDPSAAMLEVLDWEQNGEFRDHYLELPFDLSQVFFITTANTTSTIPRPLLDRMEVIEIPSYTDEEKVQIGKKYLLPQELEQHGLTKQQVKVSDLGFREIINGYTHESGVRNLQRQLAALCRKSALRMVLNEENSVQVSEKNMAEFLGVCRYHQQTYSLKERIGIVNGLAWTAVGGELLEVEVNVVSGTGKMILTGNLGDVMKESAQTALSLIRSRGEALGLPEDFHEKFDVHIHFPEGGIPKDGPSAGIAITTAIVSALTNRPVRGSVAMTGEVSLRGRVLAIGGLREKSMAALRNGVKMVLIPKENEKDLEEIDQTVRNKLQFVMVDQIDEVLDTVIFYDDSCSN